MDGCWLRFRRLVFAGACLTLAAGTSGCADQSAQQGAGDNDLARIISFLQRAQSPSTPGSPPTPAVAPAPATDPAADQPAPSQVAAPADPAPAPQAAPQAPVAVAEVPAPPAAVPPPPAPIASSAASDAGAPVPAPAAAPVAEEDDFFTRLFRGYKSGTSAASTPTPAVAGVAPSDTPAPASATSALASSATPASPAAGAAAATTASPSDAQQAAILGAPITSVQEMIGLDQSDIRARLGLPRMRRRDNPAQLWQYQSDQCILDVFLYPSGSSFRVARAIPRFRGPGRVTDAQCLESLRNVPG